MILLLLTIVAALGLMIYFAQRSMQAAHKGRNEPTRASAATAAQETAAVTSQSDRSPTDPAIKSGVSPHRPTPVGVAFEVSLGRTMRRSPEGPADLPVKPDDVWIRPGQSVSVGGFTIPGGMLYVGERLPAEGRDRVCVPFLLWFGAAPPR